MRALPRDARDVDQVFLEAVTVEDIAARAFQIDAARFARFPFVGRQPLPRVPQRVFSRSPIPLIAPRLEIRLSSPRQKHPPSALEIGAGLIEGSGCAVLLLARLRSRIETASPLPRILIMGIAGADRDRAGVELAARCLEGRSGAGTVTQ
jgi:hypothetical protein